jgi:pimeloyl-ACP methyl ester carboxylesterase
MTLNRASLGALELDYESCGTGQPVLLIHGGVLADWFEPLMSQPALAGYRLVRYRREGYGGSRCKPGSGAIVEQAAHALALLQHLGIERAHVVGHSSGGSIALQLARDMPDRVCSLALLEPVLMQVPPGPGAAEARALFLGGQPAAAVDSFMRAVCGAGYAPVLARALPHALKQAATAADTFFGRELPALRQWSFSVEDAQRLSQPVLAVVGANSDAARTSIAGPSRVFAERQQLLLQWFPHAEPHVVPEATHLMILENPSNIAERLARFFERCAPVMETP